MTNPHLARPAALAGARLQDADLAAIVVHGRNQDPEFMMGVLDRLALPEIGYVLPRAAERTWYPEGFTAPIDANQPRLDQALDTCAQALHQAGEHGFPPERTALLGFSQGACLLSEFMLRNPRRYAAAALLTGGYIGPADQPRSPTGSLANTPVFLGSSRYDEWVPIERVEATAALMREMGAQVTMQTYDDREHFVNDEAIAQTRALLTSALS
ncbi:alpha/beta hydrolase [Allosalinactinospora lopnorensis]|uniref:alpha/beta hydrolase n=1 Tax=Allosalinactinospora lopnorensis TaxID=1352348 RepID=UPI000698C1A1|nr:phospholipase [Allosalinactinospora lopnorensis]